MSKVDQRIFTDSTCTVAIRRAMANGYNHIVLTCPTVKQVVSYSQGVDDCVVTVTVHNMNFVVTN